MSNGKIPWYWYYWYSFSINYCYEALVKSVENAGGFPIASIVIFPLPVNPASPVARPPSVVLHPADLRARSQQYTKIPHFSNSIIFRHLKQTLKWSIFFGTFNSFSTCWGTDAPHLQLRSGAEKCFCLCRGSSINGLKNSQPASGALLAAQVKR